MNCYLVTARLGWETVFAGHWLAASPRAAIEIAKQIANETNTRNLPLKQCEWRARKSSATYNAMNA